MKTALVLLLSALLGTASYVVQRRLQAVHADTISRPLTVETDVYQYSADGRLAFQQHKSYARFGDGSVVYKMIQTAPSYKPQFTKIMNATRGDWIFVDEATLSSVTFRKPSEKARGGISEMEEEQGCPSNVKQLPDGGNMLGYATVHMEETPSPDIEVEKWLALDLDCLPLKEIQTASSLGKTHNVVLATSVTLGEPSRALLTVPTGYTERSPQAFEDAHVLRTGLHFFGPRLLHELIPEYAGR